MESEEWFSYNYSIIQLTAMHYNFIWLQTALLQFAYIWYSVKIKLKQRQLTFLFFDYTCFINLEFFLVKGNNNCNKFFFCIKTFIQIYWDEQNSNLSKHIKFHLFFYYTGFINFEFF
jgi:hypothetical protein